MHLRSRATAKWRSCQHLLLSTLDFEKGGKIAKDLSGLYTFLLAEMAEIGVHRDARKVERLMHIAETLRAGFTGAATTSVPAKRLA